MPFVCFVCSASGNINTLRKHLGDPPINLEISEEDEEKERKEQDATTLAIYEAATSYCQERLLESDKYMTYLMEHRGLNADTVTRFRLGYNDGTLCEHLSKTWSRTEITKSGLMTSSGHEFFDDAILIPYLNLGVVQQIRARVDHGKAKYKSIAGQQARLYNVDAALDHDGTVVVCEGEFDVMVMSQLGFSAVSGGSGAGSWKKEWNIYFEDVTTFIWYDDDSAGMKGARKVSENIVHAKVIETPQEVSGFDISDIYTIEDKGLDWFEGVLNRHRFSWVQSVQSAFDDWLAYEGNSNLDGVFLGYKEVDQNVQGGFLPSDLVVLLAQTNAGKGHPLSTELPTPLGMRAIGDLEVGDEVIGSDGKPTKVTGVYDRGVLPTYKASFKDGTDDQIMSVLCDGDHLWNVQSSWSRYNKPNSWKTLTTRELASQELSKPGKDGRNPEYKYFVPLMSDPVEYESIDLPIQPYTMGVLIANGSLNGSSVVFMTNDQEVIDKVKAEYPEIREGAPTGTVRRFYLPKMISTIRDLELDKKSGEKFIPAEYLVASIEDRKILLSALMDCDGSANKIRSCPKYYTCSPTLRDNVIELVRSLGGTAYYGVDTRRMPIEDYRISVRLPDTPFSGYKGVDDLYDFSNASRRLVSIERVEDEEIRCISVEAKDSLYVVSNHYLVTHNTIFGLNIMDNVRRAQPDKHILFLSLEQTASQWFERARRPNRFNTLQPDPYLNHLETVDLYKDNFMIVDKNRINPESIYECIAEYEAYQGCPPDLVLVDYLGYWANSFPGEAYQATSAAVMKLKEVAKEAKTIILAPHQVNRGSKQGTTVSIDDARNSGVVGETADFLFGLWNPDSVKDGPAEKAYVRKFKIDKSRRGPTGFEFDLLFNANSLVMLDRLDELVYQQAVQENKLAHEIKDYEKCFQALLKTPKTK